MWWSCTTLNYWKIIEFCTLNGWIVWYVNYLSKLLPGEKKNLIYLTEANKFLFFFFKQSFLFCFLLSCCWWFFMRMQVSGPLFLNQIDLAVMDIGKKSFISSMIRVQQGKIQKIWDLQQRDMKLRLTWPSTIWLTLKRLT